MSSTLFIFSSFKLLFWAILELSYFSYCSSRDSNLTTSIVCLSVCHQNPIHPSNQSPFSRIDFLINQLSINFIPLVNILQKSVTFARDHASGIKFLPTKCSGKFWQKHQFYCKIVLEMTWLGEIGKIYRDSVENLRENMNLRSKFY